MATNIPTNSIINLYPTIVYDDLITSTPSLDIWDSFIIGNFKQDQLRYFQLHRVSEGETWVRLARNYYNDDRLWWVIPLFNNIENPFESITTELASQNILELQVLKPEFVSQLLLLMRQKKINDSRKK